jgi:hypothetical protein
MHAAPDAAVVVVVPQEKPQGTRAYAGGRFPLCNYRKNVNEIDLMWRCSACNEQ